MIKKYLNIALAVFVLGGWGGLFKPDPVNIYAEPRALPQREMFRFAENGEAYKLNDFKDQFVIANFWSRYCSPCLRELDNLNNFSKKVADNGIKVVIISPASEWHSLEEQQKFLQKYGAPDLDFYVDKKGDLSVDLGIFTSPNTVLINRHGKEIGRIRGSVEWDDDEVIEYIYKIKAQNNQ